MRGEIITIGDELISGRVCDLNSFFLSARVSSYGLRVMAITSVGDDRERIMDILHQAVDRSDFVLVSGGLGPTEDDITTDVAADFFDLPLVLDEPFLDIIKKSLEKWGVPWVEAYRKLALIPQGASLLDPGVACGFHLDHGTVPMFFLPGVPSEVRRMTEKAVLPILLSKRRDRSAVRQRLFKIFGIQEAQIEETLDGITGGAGNISIGYYPNFPENHVTVTVRAESEEDAERTLGRLEAEVERRLAFYLVGKDAATLEMSVGRLLREKGLTLSVAESCTGGQIAGRITSVAGSSDYFERGVVVYSNRSKVELLGVPDEVIQTHGAVSEPTAEHMARGIRERSGTDIGLATTGIAGPTGGTPEKPVGTVYIGLAGPEGVRVERVNFLGPRDQVVQLTTQTALNRLLRYLADPSFISPGPEETAES